MRNCDVGYADHLDRDGMRNRGPVPKHPRVKCGVNKVKPENDMFSGVYQVKTKEVEAA